MTGHPPGSRQTSTTTTARNLRHLKRPGKRFVVVVPRICLLGMSVAAGGADR